MTKWRIEPLGQGHDRRRFDCGHESLNVFLRQHAGQNARKGISRTFVAMPEGGTEVAGYYTLSSGSISFDTLPPETARRLPPYPIPSAHLGRLAVDRRSQGQGLGGLLLVDALKRVRQAADQIGIHAVTVHALDPVARLFYLKFGFLSLQDAPNHLFLPMATIRKL